MLVFFGGEVVDETLGEGSLPSRSESRLVEEVEIFPDEFKANKLSYIEENRLRVPGEAETVKERALGVVGVALRGLLKGGLFDFDLGFCVDFDNPFVACWNERVNQWKKNLLSFDSI